MRVAMIQMKVVPGEIEENLKNAVTCIEEAAGLGCDLVLLPETCDIGWANDQALHLACTVPGDTTEVFCAVASRTSVYVVVGITEVENGIFYNSAILISDKGELLGKHRKINLLPDVEEMYHPGDKVQVYPTAYGTIGINICADNLIDSIELGSSLAKMGAKVILSPSAWAVAPEKVHDPYGSEWLEPYTLLSTQYDISVIGVSNVGVISNGPWKGWKCIGNSIAMGKNGRALTILPNGENQQVIELYDVDMA